MATRSEAERKVAEKGASGRKWLSGWRRSSAKPHADLEVPNEAGRTPQEAKWRPGNHSINEKAPPPSLSPPARQDSSHHSSSDESFMNKKTRDLSIDDGRQPDRRIGSPSKKRTGQESQSLHGSKRTRHHSNLPTRAADRTSHEYASLRANEITQDPLKSFSPTEGREQYPGAEADNKRLSQGDASSQGDGDPAEGDVTMLLQPETRPITQEQLVNEVKGIYAGLVMVEKKCVEICNQQQQSDSKHLSHEQWQALIALHRTLLHEHHDFFLASQHPTASAALRRLATKYAMPARMWRHGIHSFLELLRNRLPDSLDHMLSFVYLAYSMMALLMESVPSFLETWIECLGDLARYRMAIEEADLRDREIWSNVARMWYNKAADRSPNVGRIQHHLAVLARPNILQQLFYYSKALVSVVPFVNARESIMLLFTPFLEKADVTYSKYPPLEASLVTAFGLLFVKGSIHEFTSHAEVFLTTLDGHISRNTVKWKVQGPEVASSLIAGLLNYGTDDNTLWEMIRSHTEIIKSSQDATEDLKQDPPAELKAPGNAATVILDPKVKETLRREHWASVNSGGKEYLRAPGPAAFDLDSKFAKPDDITAHVLPVWSRSIGTVSSKYGDRNIVPFMHVTLAFLWSMTFVPGALIYLEAYVPWSKLIMFLNTLGRSSVSDARVESAEFPDSASGVGRQLPEDFPIRGLVWAHFYYPHDFFTTNVVGEDDRTLELPSHSGPRAERCLWLGARLASLGRYMTYNVETKQFSATEFALSLADAKSALDSRFQTTSVESEFDAVMVDAC